MQFVNLRPCTGLLCNKPSLPSFFIVLFAVMDASGQYVVATNATEYKAVILDSTSPGTEVLTLGIKDFSNRQRNWRYRPCSHGNTASFPFRINSASFKVTVKTLDDGEYRQCIELYDTRSTLILDNMVKISVVSDFGKLSCNHMICVPSFIQQCY